MRSLPTIAFAAALLVATGQASAQQRALEPAAQEPGRRVALVIGNDKYPQQPLRNAVADARAMGTALQKYGFRVDVAVDATFKDLSRRLEQFGSQLRPGDVALVYYAGHGIQVEGENYLVPIDFAAREESDVKYESYPASRIADRLAASGARLSILILDACRNNPFRSTRSGTRGLAPMETGRGNLVAFATAPNRTADDNPAGTNGLFTTYLLEAMDEPGTTIEQVFSRARQKVYEASGGRQIPWLVSSVIGDFYFRPPAVSSAGAEEKLWNQISKSESPEGFREYLKTFPNGAYSRLAKLYLDALTRPEVPAPSPGTVPPGAAPAGGALRDWRPHFIKAQNGVTYIPFLVWVDRLPAATTVGIYVRATRADAPSASGAKYPWEDYAELTPAPSQQTDQSLIMSVMSLPPGEYDVRMTFAPLNPERQKTEAIRDLVARVDAGDPRVFRRTVSVPDFWDGRLSLSSIILSRSASKATTESAPASIEGARRRPFVFGSLDATPEERLRFSTRDELGIVAWVYNATPQQPSGKPDVRIEYRFYKRAGGSPAGETYFNRTEPQVVNASTLPPTFDLNVHQVTAGLAVPLATFAPGEYRLQLTVTDVPTGRTVERSAIFAVY